MAALRTVAERPASSVAAQHRLQLQEEERIAIAQSKKLSRESKTVQSQAPDPPPQDLPHRRRQRRKAVVEGQAPAPATSPEESLPLDASSQLTTAATSLPPSATFRRKAATYLSLTKPRLSFLILLTTTSAYSLYPIPDILSTTASSVDTSFSTSTMTLLFLTTGTFLSCACANTFNMLFEPKYDALMTRTRNRPLVRKLISPRAAAAFAILCGASGLLLLDIGTNPTVAGLSALNIFLYAGVYTPMKRLSAANTWVGAMVGGIPPLMGWCAAAGQAATSEHHSWQDLLFSENALGGWALAALLFAWQFPHFTSLSHTIREDYRNAGHKMLAWTNPARNARVGLRYSVAMFPICGFIYWSGYVNPGFLVISTACNLWMTREAIRFWRKQGAGGSARGLFWASVWQLPLVLVGALVCKKGIWDGFLGSKEPLSVYDQNQSENDGDDLGMGTTTLHTKQSPPGDINLAMIGFKRPT
ncbi:protoheme IX farnesyltransferase [Exophiala aquamarina CBS 119918]|uniref:Protoheme IX farnesyltransferase, mitochondrial n=1 Tax=Exophiala aquamarina CBS 119918 TaxID=1182545 RepID=A0A072PUQ1_9EURO|nr:protoheme IX farnesyltransferase [Exophiala aquamarina CBS 119918]KEF63093.1 protoheme IX farnesyltransferase [Exophiala aquamarina CBS 119918]